MPNQEFTCKVCHETYQAYTEKDMCHKCKMQEYMKQFVVAAGNLSNYQENWDWVINELLREHNTVQQNFFRGFVMKLLRAHATRCTATTEEERGRVDAPSLELRIDPDMLDKAIGEWSVAADGHAADSIEKLRAESYGGGHPGGVGWDGRNKGTTWLSRILLSVIEGLPYEVKGLPFI